MKTGEIQVEVRFLPTEDGVVSNVDAIVGLGKVAQHIDDLLGDMGLHGSVRFRLSADAADAVTRRSVIEHEGGPSSIFEREEVGHDRV